MIWLIHVALAAAAIGPREWSPQEPRQEPPVTQGESHEHQPSLVPS